MVISLAQRLSPIHALSAKKFGPLDFDLQGTHADAKTYYLKGSKITVDRSDIDLTSTESDFIIDAIEKAGKIHTDLLATKTYLGHGDLWRKNIIVNQDDFKIIDWDRIGSYPVEYDLGFMIDADFTDAQKNLFFLHYSHKVNLNLLKWFALRRTMLNGKLLLKNKIAKIRLFSSV